MRLWSLHPRHLDGKGLVALWREGLLAQKVLAGGTRGYRNHPQLDRFKSQPDPLAAIAAYLAEVQREATRRGYRFDATKISPHGKVARTPVNDGQLAYELEHLKNKLAVRDPVALAELPAKIAAHPLFEVVPGGVEGWEVV